MAPQKKRILVVDNETEITRLIKLRLESDGYDVDEAHSGEEAVNQVLTQKPDLVVLDVVMPGLSGYEVCARIKDEISMSLPVIMLTSRIKMVDERIGFMCKADAYIRKPQSTEQLLPEVERLLKNKEMLTSK